MYIYINYIYISTIYIYVILYTFTCVYIYIHIYNYIQLHSPQKSPSPKKITMKSPLSSHATWPNWSAPGWDSAAPAPARTARPRRSHGRQRQGARGWSAGLGGGPLERNSWDFRCENPTMLQMVKKNMTYHYGGDHGQLWGMMVKYGCEWMKKVLLWLNGQCF